MPLKWKRATERSGYWGYDWYAETLSPGEESGRVLMLVKHDPTRDFPEGYWSLDVMDHEHGRTHSYGVPIPATDDLEKAKRYAEERRATNPAACPTGDIRRKAYTRKSYTKADGTRVPKTKVPSTCIIDRGRPGRGNKIVKDIKEGTLGGPGYTEKSQAARRTILRDCVKKADYRDCLGKLQYLLLVGGSTWPKKKLKVVQDDKKWLMKTYGGPGSFGPRSNNPAHVRKLKNSLMR